MSTGNAPFDSRPTGFGACLHRGDPPRGSNRHASLLHLKAGLYMQSLELVEQAAAYMEKVARRENSCGVMPCKDGDLVWVTETDGSEVRYYDGPQMTPGQRLISGAITVLPVEQWA